MDSQLAIHTIKESCYRVGYPTHDAEHEHRKLINQSCDYAIECIEKLDKIENLITEWESLGQKINCSDDRSFLIDIQKVLEQE